jgi:acyl-CoA thioester hydrolase
VYWEDTDAGGIVYYANHLKFFERARTEWLRAQGHDQQRLRDETGAMFVVSDVRLRYLAPARLDDELEIAVELREQGRASMLFGQSARRAGTLLVEGEVRIGCVDATSLRPRRVPDALLPEMLRSTAARRTHPPLPNMSCR